MGKDNIIQYDFTGDFLTFDATFTGEYGFPVLSEQTCTPDFVCRPINYILSDNHINEHWYHCFIDDYQFERFWNNFYKYEDYFRQAAGIITTDFSMYRDKPKQVQIRNCYRNRAMAYAIQKLNKNVIPTAGFADESTWDWCFDGLPQHSTVAITTNGTLSDPEARRIFIGGIDALVKTLNPYALVVCGNYPQWLNTKYKNLKIIPITNFNQFRKLGRIA